jgi:putative endonuclease
MSLRRRNLGKRGEEAARAFLEKNGYTVVTSNYRTRSGEIDLVALDGQVLVFVEVKTRSGQSYGSPWEAITPKKQKQISKVAAEYLIHNKVVDSEARFDVVAVTVGSSGPCIELLKNAFELSYG